MITSFFRKSTPLNYTVVILALLFFFFYYQFKHITADNSLANLLRMVVQLCSIFASMFITNFIAKKNGISKDSAYSVFIFLVFLLFFPAIMKNTALIIANLFILLASRRIISLQSLKQSKEKIFDSSLWVFLAVVFHFWSILFIVLVFIAILFHVARDYRNWFLPMIAFVAIAVLFVGSSLFLENQWISNLIAESGIDLRVDYFANNNQNLAFSAFTTIGMFFILSLLLTLSNRPLILQPTYKKVISAVVIGSAVFIVSPHKSNDILVFTFAPLAMVATSFFETAQANWKKEIAFWILLLSGLFAFFSQL